uniref:Uncharacterized protein n=1 Tax=Oryza nivara TaxID=4536 RepID=A0A0E0G0G8_ORYNI
MALDLKVSFLKRKKPLGLLGDSGGGEAPAAEVLRRRRVPVPGDGLSPIPMFSVDFRLFVLILPHSHGYLVLLGFRSKQNQEGHVVVVSAALVGRRRPSRSLRCLLLGTSTRAPFLPPCHLSGSHRVRPPRPCAAPNPAVPQPHSVFFLCDTWQLQLMTVNSQPLLFVVKDDKTDLKLKKHLQELEQMLDQIVSEHVKLHRLVHSSDRGYFERISVVKCCEGTPYIVVCSRADVQAMDTSRYLQ